MKKISWIVALLLALSFSALFISGCGSAFDPTKLPAQPWTIDAGKIVLEKVGSNEGTSAEGNTFTNKAGGGATSAGFAWKVPEDLGKSESGLTWDQYEKVRVTIKIVALKQPAAGVSYNAKADRALGTDVNKIDPATGKQSGKPYDNATIVIGKDGDEGYSDYPVSGFKASGEIAFQYNVWEGNTDIVAGGGREIPNHKIEVGFTFYTGTIGEEFVPVTKIELEEGEAIAFADFTLKAKVTPEGATNSEVIWSILAPGLLTTVDGKKYVDVKGDTKLKAGLTDIYPTNYDGTADDVENKTTAGLTVNFKDQPPAKVPGGLNDDSVYPWTYDPDTTKSLGRYPNIINAQHTSNVVYKLSVVAIIIDGKGSGENYVEYLEINVKPNPLVSINIDRAVPLASVGGFGENINDMFGGITATNYPKYAIVLSYAGNAGADFETPNEFEWGVNKASGWVTKKSGKLDKITADSKGLVYFVLPLKDLADYMSAVTAGGWLQLVSGYEVGYGDLFRVYVCNPTVITLTRPANAKDFTGAAVGLGYLSPTLPVELNFVP